MRGGGGGKKVGARCHVNIHPMNTCHWLNSFVAMSHSHPDFEHPSHLFNTITHHNGWTVSRNTTVVQLGWSDWPTLEWSNLAFYCLLYHVMCYMPAKILNLAHERNVHYIDFLLADKGEHPCILSISQAWVSLIQHFKILTQRTLHNI